MTEICDRQFDEERALYALCDATVESCTFAGEADGESALKETNNLTIQDCLFALRYPLWHTHKTLLTRCDMTPTCRAALWYDTDVTLRQCSLGGIKALRECDGVTLEHCKADSQEFGWFCKNVTVSDCELTSEYPFMHSAKMTFNRFTLNGKYSFQYVKNVTISDSVLNTKDAFWHSENVTVKDSVINGEYLGWYSENLTLIRCKIKGTQPLCYAKNLTLVDCEMTDCDLSFENSTLEATVKGRIESIKCPEGGHVTCDDLGALITDKALARPEQCKITVCKK